MTKKLSDVNPIKAFFLPEDELNNYVFRTKRTEVLPGKHYDAALVLGCSIYSVLEARTNEALNLYNCGMVNKLILSGGIGFFSTDRTMTEADKMKEILLKAGVPEEDIICESKSINTAKNMDNVIPYIQEQFGDDTEIILVTSDFHMKRALGNFNNKFDCNIVPDGVLDGVHDMGTWNHGKFKTKRLLRTEEAMISWFVMIGSIKDQEVEPVKTRTLGSKTYNHV